MIVRGLYWPQRAQRTQRQIILVTDYTDYTDFWSVSEFIGIDRINRINRIIATEGHEVLGRCCKATPLDHDGNRSFRSVLLPAQRHHDPTTPSRAKLVGGEEQLLAIGD